MAATLNLKEVGWVDLNLLSPPREIWHMQVSYVNLLDDTAAMPALYARAKAIPAIAGLVRCT